MFNHKKSVVLSDHTYFHMLLASQEASKNPFQLWRWPNFLKELTAFLLHVRHEARCFQINDPT